MACVIVVVIVVVVVVNVVNRLFVVAFVVASTSVTQCDNHQS